MKGKRLFWSYVVTMFAGVHSVQAEIAPKPIEDIDVFVFNAECVLGSRGGANLFVDLLGEKVAESFLIQARFVNYDEPGSFDANTEALTIEGCEQYQAKLLSRAGLSVPLSGLIFEKPYQAVEDVWVMCRGSRREGREPYPCKNGSRVVTRIQHKVVFEFEGIQLFHEDKI